MKAKFFFLGLCALALAACSIDEVSQVNDTNAIQFKATTATRAAAVTTNSIQEFTVWAWNDSNEFMDHVTATKQSNGTFTTSPYYFWPTGTVDFYALHPASVGYGVSETTNDELAYIGGEISIEEDDFGGTHYTYTGNVATADISEDNIVIEAYIPGDTDSQIDLCYAITKERSSGAVPMNFRHALSQVVFKAKDINPDFVVDIAEVSVCSVNRYGKYTLNKVASTTTDITEASADSHGVWSDWAHKTRFEAGIDAQTLDTEGTVVDITSDPLLLIPQEVEGWDPLTDTSDKELGSYIRVLCHVTEHGSTLWPNDSETNLIPIYDETSGETVNYAYIAMPVDVAWEEGYRYTYTIIFGEGLGYYPPDDPNTDLEGTPVLNIITFNVTVDEFQDAEGVEVDTTTETEEEEPFEPTGAGTVEEPYSIADVLGLIEEGETSDEMVYVSGIVSEISEVSPLSVTSGHATYFISDDGTTENQIEVFDGLYLGGLAFDEADEIKVGDEIVVYGYLEMVDETPEITNSVIYSLNGETYQEPELELEGDGTVDNPYTVTDLFTLIEAGETIEEKVYVTGLVGSITGFDSEKGTENYYISVDGTNSDESVYVLEGLFLGGKPFEYMNDIERYNEVVVYGYFGTDTEGNPQITESEIYSLNGSTYEEPTLTYIDGYEYVDLGLSVLWATCNIGAETPTAYGNYYAWGEIETKETYSYSTSVTYNKEMEDFSGNADYDAATAIWGSNWRMPTATEYEELIENCTVTTLIGEDYYTVGYRFTSIVNGNSIDFSRSGYYSSGTHYGAGTTCEYWTSSPYGDNKAQSTAFQASSTSIGTTNVQRYYGVPIRPVADKEN